MVTLVAVLMPQERKYAILRMSHARVSGSTIFNKKAFLARKAFLLKMILW